MGRFFDEFDDSLKTIVIVVIVAACSITVLGANCQIQTRETNVLELKNRTVQLETEKAKVSECMKTIKEIDTTDQRRLILLRDICGPNMKVRDDRDLVQQGGPPRFQQ